MAFKSLFNYFFLLSNEYHNCKAKKFKEAYLKQVLQLLLVFS